MKTKNVLPLFILGLQYVALAAEPACLRRDNFKIALPLLN
jgi:hypothetical protein